MSDTASTLTALLDQNKPACRSVGYAAPIRQRVGVWAAEQRALGRSWSDIADQLPIATTTVIGWTRLAAEATFVPVVVAGHQGASHATTGPVVISPRGWRVEGLDLDAVVRVLGEVG